MLVAGNTEIQGSNIKLMAGSHSGKVVLQRPSVKRSPGSTPAQVKHPSMKKNHFEKYSFCHHVIHSTLLESNQLIRLIN